jgi:4'-phosphopantetheinyl transferase
MPLFFSLEEKNLQLAVWKMDEELEELLSMASLSESDMLRLNSFSHEPRKKEWISIRMLLKRLGYSSSIAYHETGKPFLNNSQAQISISHTRDYAGIIISDSSVVGLDLERIHPRIENIAHKFLSREEESHLPTENILEHLFVIWGVKEVLFKMHHVGELLFKEHLHVKPFNFRQKGFVQASINKDNFQKIFSLEYELKEDLLITRCVE